MYGDYKGLVQVDVRDRELQLMLDKTYLDSAEPRQDRFYPTFVAVLDLIQSTCNRPFVSLKNPPILLLKVPGNVTSPSCPAYAVGAIRHNPL